jgi:two-component system, NtrC family, response regulator PilR
VVVDDERSMREMLEVYLSRQGYRVACAGTLAEGLETLQQRAPDLVITDLKLGKQSGLSVLEAAKKMDASIEVIIMTAFSTVETAVQAMKAGAYDYVQKPFNLDELQLIVERALERRRLVAENERLRTELGERPSGILVARSAVMHEVLKLIDKIAAVRANILITGESGVGKEVVAREIHARGPRKDQPFLAINCGAIPEGLIESELFGRVKGAFTGAVANREGLLAAAGEGTLFLDEIGELPKETQVKLLRVIQERKARPVGSTQDFNVEARLVAATNRDLSAEVAAGRFREDLYYRLNVIHLHIPPLRERREDVVPLAEHFLRLQAERQLRKVPWTLSKEAVARLLDHGFPGNVRELENAIERATALTDDDEIGKEILPDAAGPALGSFLTIPQEGIELDAVLRRVERELIVQALTRTGGTRVAAAKLLGTSFRSLRYRLEKLGFEPRAASDDEGEST